MLKSLVGRLHQLTSIEKPTEPQFLELNRILSVLEEHASKNKQIPLKDLEGASFLPLPFDHPEKECIFIQVEKSIPPHYFSKTKQKIVAITPGIIKIGNTGLRLGPGLHIDIESNESREIFQDPYHYEPFKAIVFIPKSSTKLEKI